MNLTYPCCNTIQILFVGLLFFFIILKPYLTKSDVAYFVVSYKWMIMYCLHAIIFITQPYKSWLGEFEKQVSEASNDSKEVS